MKAVQTLRCKFAINSLYFLNITCMPLFDCSTMVFCVQGRLHIIPSYNSSNSSNYDKII